MIRVRLAAISLALVTVFTALGQGRNTWRSASDIQEGDRGSIVGTVADVDEARSQIIVEADDDTGPRIVVLSDAVSTQYNAFGGVINGQPEIFTGDQGLANVRVGDRIDVRGLGAGNGAVRAEVITLRSRQVPASQTGVGSTRTPTSVSTPTAISTSTSDRVAPFEGVVQEVNASDGRLVIVTDRREIMTVRTSSATPVTYKGDTLRVANLGIGDRIRITPEGSFSADSELRAGSINVVRSAQDTGSAPRSNALSGRVTRVDRTLDMVTVDTGRSSIRVDVGTTSDTAGRRVRALDFRTGEHVDLGGRYSPTANDLFIASSVRFADEPTPTTGAIVDAEGTPVSGEGELGAVAIYGTVREGLAESPQLVVRDSNGRTVRVNVLEDFVVRMRGGGYVTAEHLKPGDSVAIKALRDYEGNYIAQTIRIR